MSNPEINEHFTEEQIIVQNDENSPTVENSDSTESKPRILVPTEFLAEFLSSVMTKDYEKALNFCTQILSHEPNNSTALEFYPLIVEKLEMKLEDSSSESSETYSSTSSEKSLLHHKSFPSQTKISYSSFESDKFNDFSETSVIPLERKLSTGNTEIMNPNTCTQKITPKTLTKKKTNPIDAQSPSNLKTYPEEKKPLKNDNKLKSEAEASSETKVKNQKAQKKSITFQLPPKALLHSTKTQTFPKRPPTSKN